jgi:hypothetical protein
MDLYHIEADRAKLNLKRVFAQDLGHWLQQNFLKQIDFKYDFGAISI